jgi:hypothetical protein
VIYSNTLQLRLLRSIKHGCYSICPAYWLGLQSCKQRPTAVYGLSYLLPRLTINQSGRYRSSLDLYHQRYRFLLETAAWFPTNLAHFTYVAYRDPGSCVTCGTLGDASTMLWLGALMPSCFRRSCTHTKVQNFPIYSQDLAWKISWMIIIVRCRCELCSFRIWAIWTARNENEAWRERKECKLLSNGFGRQLQTRWVWWQLCQSKNKKQDGEVQWGPPKIGEVKVNTDGAFSLTSSFTGAMNVIIWECRRGPS